MKHQQVLDGGTGSVSHHPGNPNLDTLNNTYSQERFESREHQSKQQKVGQKVKKMEKKTQSILKNAAKNNGSGNQND